MKSLKPFLGFLTGICAVITLGVFTFFILNGIFKFVEVGGTVLIAMEYVKMYGTLATCGLAALHAVADKGFILNLFVLLLLGVIIISTFFPAVQEQLLGYIGKNATTTPEAALIL